MKISRQEISQERQIYMYLEPDDMMSGRPIPGLCEIHDYIVDYLDLRFFEDIAGKVPDRTADREY